MIVSLVLVVIVTALPRGLSMQLLLTQADVVMEKSEEVVALFPVVATRCAGAPGSHVGCGVVKVVGSYCASCREEDRLNNTALYVYRRTEVIQLHMMLCLQERI